MEHHDRALAAYLDDVRRDPDVLAVILVGSLARGSEREDSDVDLYLVVTDERFARETDAGRFAWTDRHGLDYPGSYIDIKLASPAYLHAAVERGDDSTRASFSGARVAYAVEPGFDDLVARISALPDAAWNERVRSHVAQARLYGGYFLVQGAERGDEFLVRHASVHLTLAAARAALAAAHVLMPGPKYISKLVRSVPSPDGFVQAWDRAVREPGTQSGSDLLNRLMEWLGNGVTSDETLSTFIRDNELSWLRGGVPAEYF
ncbi:nucleotidyltransferase domain-containing protein [Humibacter sp.]|uniref:nucleotidyltransferase domain-containing protein n=1 Tax=Humibacter sp. TaxID=1940291 RepID=UPI003F80BE50